MGDYVLESCPALERLIERVRARDEGGSEGVEDDVVHDEEDLGGFDENQAGVDEFIDALDEDGDTEYPVRDAEPADKQYEVAGRPPRANGRALRALPLGTARKAESSSKKVAAADRRLELSFHGHESFIGPTTKQWRLMATPDVVRVSSAERRFAMSVGHSKAAMLAAADELDAATRDATTWLTAHPCPDSNLRDQIAAFVCACAEVAVTSRWSVTGALADTHAVMSRLGALLNVIDRQIQRLDAWGGGAQPAQNRR